jgi:HD-GYP domain-containing protein (c-di-GMP phosphodiesterase class II)
VTETLIAPNLQSQRLQVTLAVAGYNLPSGLEARLKARGLRVTGLELPAPDGPAPARRGPTVGLIASDVLPKEIAAATSVIQTLADASYDLVLVGDAPEGMADALSDLVDSWLPAPAMEGPLLTAVKNALKRFALRQELEQTRVELTRTENETNGLFETAAAMGAEHDLTKLENLILERCRALTQADGGTLYLVDEDADKKPVLRFEVSQSDTLGNSYTRFTLPLSMQSISGYVGTTGHDLNLEDVYNLPEGVPFSFARTFDERMGYRSKSMLTVPMKTHEGQVVGVIQLINKKRTPHTKLKTPQIVEKTVIPFTQRDEHVLDAFTGQAAMALDNRLLVDSIETMFEGFVRASVQAIEARDPTTSGHSFRVGEVTTAIAAAVNEIRTGKWKTVNFDDKQLTEIRYAGLLHDFGKIGVREPVLVKAKKLYDWQIEVVKLRFAYARKAVEAAHNRKQLEYALANGKEGFMAALAHLDAEYEREVGILDEDIATILQANEPTVLEQDSAERLVDIGKRMYRDIDGSTRSLLDSGELLSLSVRRGTLTEEERHEIESHVSHTYKFLSIMPWSRNLRNVPNIAGAHHEKLDGTGYPFGLKAEEIPIQSKMMTIADIYDALTASDRPYKRAVPIPKALDILVDEVRVGHVDKDLLDVFIQKKVFEVGHKDDLP